MAHLAIYLLPAAALDCLAFSGQVFTLFTWDPLALMFSILLALGFYGYLGTFRMLTYIRRLRKIG